MDSNEIGISTAKMAGGVGLAWYAQYTLQEWVAVVTIAYIILQLGLLLPKYWILFQRIGKTFACCFKKFFGKSADAKLPNS